MANNAAREMMGSVAGDIAVGTMMALVVVKPPDSGADDVRSGAMVKSSHWVQGPAMSRIDVELSIRLPTQII
jgi:hypothetical protein